MCKKNIHEKSNFENSQFQHFSSYEFETNFSQLIIFSINVLQAPSRNCENRLLAPLCLFGCRSFRPNGTTRLPQEGFSLNFSSEYFSKICRENSSYIKIWQESQVLYIKTDICTFIITSRPILLRMRIFQTIVVQEIKTHFI